MLDFYQNLPEIINPIAFSIGFLSIRWYSLMYIIGFIIVVFLLRWRIHKKEGRFEWDDILDLLIYSFLGIIVGGRLGYVLFYNLNYFLSNPLEIIIPIKNTTYGLQITGLYGMSYFGAVLGIIIVFYFFSKKRKLNFWRLLDFALPAVPAGYFFGRLGNFLNGELYGRTTDLFLGMNFNGELRHPSQLYEAFFEGVVLFVILWLLRNKLLDRKGMITGIYLAGYGISRFLIEFFREPDSQLGFVLGSFTSGQIFALIFFLGGTFLFYRSKSYNS